MKKRDLRRCGRNGKKQKKEDNETVLRKLQHSDGQWSCPICPPWKGENALGRKNGKHGKTKPKYKNKRG